MMKIDTTDVPGYEDKQVVLEFQHKTDRVSMPRFDGRRVERRLTGARLVEVTPSFHPEIHGVSSLWRKTPSGNYKRTIAEYFAVTNPEDTYCKETGRRVSLRHLHEVTRKADGPWLLTAAAIRQYFETR